MENVERNGEEGISEFEAYLNHSLTQIKPNPAFVDNLQKRLSSGPATILENRKFQTSYLILALAVFGGLFVVWLIRFLSKKLS